MRSSINRINKIQRSSVIVRRNDCLKHNLKNSLSRKRLPLVGRDWKGATRGFVGELFCFLIWELITRKCLAYENLFRLGGTLRICELFYMYTAVKFFLMNYVCQTEYERLFILSWPLNFVMNVRKYTICFLINAFGPWLCSTQNNNNSKEPLHKNIL